MKRKNITKLGLVLACGVLLAGVPVLAKTQTEQKWEYTQKQQTGGLVYAFDELELTLPSTWDGKFVTEVQDGSITFYHKDSLEAGNKDGETGCGALFTLHCSADYDFVENLENYYLVGSGEKGIYYATVPGDLHGYQKDQAILGQWVTMSDETQEIFQNIKTKNPGAPVYTNTGVNFRDKDSLAGKVLDVIDADTRVWATGNLELKWTKVRYDDQDGYVSSDYLEFPDLTEEEDLAYETGQSGNTDKKNTASNSKNDEEEIPFQGFDQCTVFDAEGNRHTIKMAEDKLWYDENGVLFGNYDYIDSSIERRSITNEYGEKFTFTYPSDEVETDDDEIPFQGFDQCIVYSAEGTPYLIKAAEDKNWYDEFGVCFGSYEDVLNSDTSITNENGETFTFIRPSVDEGTSNGETPEDNYGDTGNSEEENTDMTEEGTEETQESGLTEDNVG